MRRPAHGGPLKPVRSVRPAVLGLAIWFVACARGGAEDPADANELDASTDAALTDAIFDAPSADAAADAGAEAGTDSGVDAGIDAAIDSGADAGVNPCAVNPCANGGVCVADGAAFTCTCTLGYDGTTCTHCASGYQDNDANGTCTRACGTGGACSGYLGCDDTSGTAACNVCPITPGSALAWSLVPPVRANWDTLAQVSYAADNRASLSAFAWSRIGYCLVLDANVTYVEMDDYTGHMLSRVAPPMDWTFEQAVTGLTIRTNASAVTAASLVSTGSIEMWSNCYAAGLNGVCDYDDDISVSADCYGSFQVHNAMHTVIAWNGWSYGVADSSLGMGDYAGSSGTIGKDWTDAYNASLFMTRTLYAYLVP